jgi:hypothetical protein
MVRRAVERMIRFDRRGARIQEAALFLDSDVLNQNSDRDKKAIALAGERRLGLIWQTPCHEAFLLRHFAGLSDRRPPTRTVAEAELR